MRKTNVVWVVGSALSSVIASNIDAHRSRGDACLLRPLSPLDILIEGDNQPEADAESGVPT